MLKEKISLRFRYIPVFYSIQHKKLDHTLLDKGTVFSYHNFFVVDKIFLIILAQMVIRKNKRQKNAEP